MIGITFPGLMGLWRPWVSGPPSEAGWQLCSGMPKPLSTSPQHLPLYHHPLLHQAGGPSGHYPLHHLPGAFLVRLEASLHDLRVAPIREASFSNMDDVNILGPSSTGRPSSWALVLGLAVWIGLSLGSRSLHQSPWIFNSSHLHSLSGGHLGSGSGRQQGLHGRRLPILLQRVQATGGLPSPPRPGTLPRFSPSSTCTEQIRHIRKAFVVVFGPDLGVSASDYAGCNLVNKPRPLALLKP
jgi:hypothetical protein